MQAATDAVKSALGQEDAPKGQFERGYKPNAAAEKEAQGGEDSRPPGKQYALVDKPVDDVYADGTPYVGTDKLKGKVMLITGGDSGIGRSTAILAAIEGANVSIVYLPEEQKDADDVKTYIAAKAPQSEVLLLPLDLKSESNCKLAVEKTVEKFGRLDSVFLNAAQQLENHDITTLDSKQWEDTFQVNIFHAFYVARHSVPHLTKNPSSTIVINASVNAFIGRPDLLDYTSTKGALVSFMRGLANQQASKGLRVNAVAPVRPIVTPLVSSTFSKENIEGVNSGPMARPGQPVEVATAVMFLASKDSSYVTGNTLHVNGGMYVH